MNLNNDGVKGFLNDFNKVLATLPDPGADEMYRVKLEKLQNNKQPVELVEGVLA